MPNQPNSPADDAPELHDLSRAKKPIIKILLYTDDPEVRDDTVKAWGLGLMKAHLLARQPAFASLCVELIDRNSNTDDPAKNKLYPETINKYDQIWFFGIHQIKRENFTLGILRGGPESELDNKEVAALTKWMRVGKEKGMKGGGVLMTGDHANEPPKDAINAAQDLISPAESEHEHFLGLGRALGHRVPRAGRLRNWKGPPTRFKEDSFNTQVLTSGTDPEDLGFHSDPVPQQLILQTFNSKGEPIEGGQPHPLFSYIEGRWIQVFPDHMHEGSVVIPRKLNKRIWPKGKARQPKPQVVAHGIDKRNARLLNIVAAYNGDAASVGRIVADSTWHHYFNVNLNNFRPPGIEDSPADQIGRFYANLAVWLAPRRTRYEMACTMIHELSNHPRMFEEAGLPEENGIESRTVEVLKIGRIAFSILSEAASPCEIHELFQALIPEPHSNYYETLYFPDKASTLSYLPSKELFLGGVISRYRRRMAMIESSGEEAYEWKDGMAEVIATGFKEAREIQGELLSLTTKQILAFENENF